MSEQMSDRHYSWWAGDGENPETFIVNEKDRATVIAAAQREFDGSFTIVEATQDGPFEVNPFDDDLIEMLIERFADDNCHRFGEDGFDGDIDQERLTAAMNAAFAAFIAANGHDIRAWSFTDQRHRELINGAELEHRSQ